MDTCFLFSKKIDATGCMCLKLSQEGELISPLQHRNFDEILELQTDSTTIVIETSENTTLLELELTWLPDRKARIAIPFALEDQVAQPIDELHFAFDKLRYNDNKYLVTVISKQRLTYIMELLANKAISYDLITIDWFALSFHQLLITDSTLLVYNDNFKGALSEDLAISYLKNHPLNPPLLFEDSDLIDDPSLEIHPENSHVWIARRFLTIRPLNLCQGSMQHESDSEWIKKGYEIAGILGCFWLVSLLIINGLSLYSINKQTKIVDTEISTIYHHFFPEAKQVISPQFRISQLLSNNNSESQGRFWFLLNNFAKGMDDSKLEIEQLRYQNKSLSTTVVGADFPTLEQLENKLKSLHLQVRQTQASTKDQKVVATLELT